MSVKAPYLPYPRLRGIAEEFFNDHYPERTIPVRIEYIVDVLFEIDIVATPGLKPHFDVDAFITSDFSTIYVDEGIHDHYSKHRYRFSLAHELAHVIIHKEVFAELAFSTIQEWKDVTSAIPPEDYSFIEWQAYALGGLILVPPAELRASFDTVCKVATDAGVELDESSDEAKAIIEAHIGRHFEVSRDVVTRRTKADKLWVQ